jgi:predicted NACHT family NTPase
MKPAFSFKMSCITMDRKVRQINAKAGTSEEEKLRPFSAYSASPNLVLLGDPGAGKTHLFKEAAAAGGGQWLTARAFLVTPSDRLSGQDLFIDGLDEKRSGRGDRDTVDATVEKLFAVNPRKVRISCRAADWLGESDLKALRPYFEPSGDPPVVLLEKLSREEQRAVLTTQGIEPEQADTFLAQAEERGLGDFLENPQNLIMLWRTVQGGTWPNTRRELFELATALMLQEFDPDRARSGTGVFSVNELRPTAGGILAARLISDIEAISLSDQEGSQDIPGYRSLSFLEPSKSQAALGRRVFVTGPEPETVDYAHRTIAEYLGAAFLAQSTRDGLPFGRVAALMGVDGHPSAELRGLHAWLAVHLPEHSDQLIEADPYGVLTYGDAASLTRSSCAYLVQALGRLSRTNPWFRSGNWQSHSIGALARPDMVDEFRAVLGDPDAGFGIRSVVVDALAMGPPMPAMTLDLAAILVRDQSPFAERAHALFALLRLGDDGKAAVIRAFNTGLGMTLNGLRLRAEIIQRLYGEPFGPADVVTLVNESQETDGVRGTGMLWTLADKLPLADLPAVLDEVNPPKHDDDAAQDRDSWEAGSFYARILVRVWRTPGVFDAGRALNWLSKRQAFSDLHSGGRGRDLRAAMQEAPERVRALAEHFVRTLVVDGNRWLSLARFREATFYEFSTDALLDLIIEHMNAEETGSDRELFFYEACFGLTYSASPPHAEVVFERLFDVPAGRTDLLAIRDRSISSSLPAGYLDRIGRRPAEEENSVDALRQNFERDAEQIRTGAHIGWLHHIANIYFGFFNDVDQNASPHERLLATIGETHSETARAGFRALLSRPDVPTFDEAITRIGDRNAFAWWHGLIAGLNEKWPINGLDGVPDDLLRALLAFDLTNPVSEERDGSTHWITHPWKQAILNERPELAWDAFSAVARARLSKGEQHADGLHELLTEEPFEPFRKDTALTFLREFPNAVPYRLGELLDAATRIPEAHKDLLAIADDVLSGALAVDERQRDMWLTTAYLLSPAKYEAELERVARARPALVFDLRDRSGFALHERPQDGSLSLPLLEVMARLTDTLYRDTSHPSSGWWGDTGAWDASDHFRNLVGMISAIPTEAATNSLARLAANAGLASYRGNILHALANQRQRRRDTEYDRPDWPQTVKALSNGPPATVADLYALLVQQLIDLRTRIERENTDLHKSFWNVDSYARPVAPRPEEACRDTLLALLKPLLLPLGVTAEPEGHMVGDKRADMSVAMPGRKILVELKRDYHTDVWTAVEGQLERYYAHDPEAKGFGVFCVFWFGDKRPSAIPAPPGGLFRPRSASEMEQMVRGLMPLDHRSRLAVIVIDVSGQV